VAESAPKFSENQLQQWKLIAQFRQLLADHAPQASEHPGWSARKLQQFDYLSLFLLGLVNPTIKTLRALSVASHWERVQQEVCGHAVALGSLSEAQHLVDPQLLEGLIQSLSEQISKQGALPTDLRQAWQVGLAQDSSLFEATARMFWAQYGGGKAGRANHAVRLHVSLHLWDEQPARVRVTPGKVCERKVWREHLEAGATYVGDRYYGQDFKMFARLAEKGCHFVLRLRDEAVLTKQQENAVDAAAAQAGVEADVWGVLGSVRRYRTAPLRVLTIRKPSGLLMRLVTNFSPEQMSASQILTLYRRRWQVECFFRWLKCLLGCRHWLAQSQTGVTVQLYLAVIAGLMLQLVLGRRPSRRLWECVQLHLTGWVKPEELLRAVQAEWAKVSAKKSVAR
jgi:hypothetical protein